MVPDQGLNTEPAPRWSATSLKSFLLIVKGTSSLQQGLQHPQSPGYSSQPGAPQAQGDGDVPWGCSLPLGLELTTPGRYTHEATCPPGWAGTFLQSWESYLQPWVGLCLFIAQGDKKIRSWNYLYLTTSPRKCFLSSMLGLSPHLASQCCQ